MAYDTVDARKLSVEGSKTDSRVIKANLNIYMDSLYDPDDHDAVYEFYINGRLVKRLTASQMQRFFGV